MRRIEGGLRRTKMLLRTMGFSESGIWSYDALDGIENWILWLYIPVELRIMSTEWKFVKVQESTLACLNPVLVV